MATTYTTEAGLHFSFHQYFQVLQIPFEVDFLTFRAGDAAEADRLLPDNSKEANSSAGRTGFGLTWGSRQASIFTQLIMSPL